MSQHSMLFEVKCDLNFLLDGIFNIFELNLPPSTLRAVQIEQLMLLNIDLCKKNSTLCCIEITLRTKKKAKEFAINK